MLPYAEWEMPLRFVFQHDNDPKHKSKVVSEWINEKRIKVLEWPAQSPDLNPIENMWSIMKHHLGKINCTNKKMLLTEAEKVWQNIDRGLIEKLLSSMPKRCEEVLKNRGYWTKY